MVDCDCEPNYYRRVKMKRIYIREYTCTGKTKWQPIGWKCPSCHKMELDKEKGDRD